MNMYGKAINIKLISEYQVILSTIIIINYYYAKVTVTATYIPPLDSLIWCRTSFY